MTTSDLKLMIFRQLDSLEKSKLEDVYGLLTNYLNGQKDLQEWNALSEIKKHGIIEAIEEMDSGKSTSSSKVIDKFKNKYSNG